MIISCLFILHKFCSFLGSFGEEVEPVGPAGSELLSSRSPRSQHGANSTVWHRTPSQVPVCCKSVLDASDVPPARPLQSKREAQLDRGRAVKWIFSAHLFCAARICWNKGGSFPKCSSLSLVMLAAVISTGMEIAKDFKTPAVLTPAKCQAFLQSGTKTGRDFQALLKHGTGVRIKATSCYIRSFFHQSPWVSRAAKR